MLSYVTTDTKWIVGTGVAVIVSVVGTGVALGTLVFMQIDMQIDGVNTRIDDLRADLTEQITELRTDVRGLDGRLRAVEVGLGKLDQRLLTIERVVLPSTATVD